MQELVDDGRTGLLFKPASAGDLARKVDQLIADPSLPEMRIAARKQFELNYPADHNYELLIDIYERAIQSASQSEAQKCGASI